MTTAGNTPTILRKKCVIPATCASCRARGTFIEGRQKPPALRLAERSSRPGRGPRGELSRSSFAERRKPLGAGVDDAVMHGLLVAILRSDIGAGRGDAIRELRIQVIEEIEASGCHLLAGTEQRAGSDDRGKDEEGDTRGFHVHCPW